MHTKNKRSRGFHLIVGKVKVGKVERKQVRKNDETLCANPIKKTRNISKWMWEGLRCCGIRSVWLGGYVSILCGP